MTAKGFGIVMERHIGVLANNRNVLAAALTMIVEQARLQGIAVAGAPLLRQAMPCGHVFVAQTVDDIPQESLLCTCGNPQHWFVKYERTYQEMHKN